MQFCTEPGCPRFVERGRCTEHTAARNQELHQGPGRKVYNSKRWRMLRLAVLADEPICRACQERLATDADHITPLSDGGPAWDRSNIQPLCHPCHSAKTAGETLRP